MIRFHLKDMLLAVCVVSVACGWLVDHYRLSEQFNVLKNHNDKSTFKLNTAIRALKQNGFEVDETDNVLVVYPQVRESEGEPRRQMKGEHN